MALVNTTSVAGFLVLLYLSTFVLFQALRFATGISIQRFGLTSLRHISYTPREGFRISIRGLGLSLHKPTFAQPTWVSLKLEELKVAVDPTALQTSQSKSKQRSPKAQENGTAEHGGHGAHESAHSSHKPSIWQQLTKVKENLKRLHRQTKWLRMLDVMAVDTTFEVTGVGSVQLQGFTLAVHTKKRFLDRGRLFRHKKDPSGEQRPAEWVFTFKSMVLQVNDREPVEVLDLMAVNIHGLLYKDKEGLRDTSIAVKLGRLYLPIDDVLMFSARSKAIAEPAKHAKSAAPAHDVAVTEVLHEQHDHAGGREAAIVKTVAESREFFSSILHSVQEIQLAMSFVRVSKEIESLKQANLPLVMNLVTHEVGIDLHRLHQDSPAHRMYFSREDIAHTAIVAAISISISLDDATSTGNKIVYIPMATTTVRTTLPSRTMNIAQERDIDERNKNILFANLVITSPSVDLVAQHMIQLLALMEQRVKNNSQPQTPHERHRLISRLLPKASIKISIHEPVVRFVLPVVDPKYAGPGEFDMIISAVSSISLDIESSHAPQQDHLYSLGSSFRMVSHRLYYQAASGAKHNLVILDTLELKAQVDATTEVFVMVSGNLRSFSVLMVREEVSKGVYNIVRHFRRATSPKKIQTSDSQHSRSPLRKLPVWLLDFRFEGSECSVEMAGIDKTVSQQTRGLALELESWSIEYLSQRMDPAERSNSKRKSSTSRHDDVLTTIRPLSHPMSPPSKRHHDLTDGRRLALHVKGLEGSIIESPDTWEAHPFLSLPRFEVALSTNRDQQGPVFHINSALRALYLDYSLYRYYSIGVAGMIMKEAFLGPPGSGVKPLIDLSKSTSSAPHGLPPISPKTQQVAELITIDFKASYIQVKAQLPADPRMLLQIYDISTGRHRWSPPFVRAFLVRIHVAAPRTVHAWARITSISGLRLDFRKVKRKTQHGFHEEKTIDLATDFIRMAVPHGVQVFRIIDNLKNTMKTIKQLQHRFKTRTNEYILQTEPEEAKHVPRISLRTKSFMFEFEDDPFEWKIGTIYHVGRIEQKQRLARDGAFRLKVKRLNERRNPRSQSRYHSTPSSRPASPERSRSRERKHGRNGSRESIRQTFRRGRSRSRDATRLRYDPDGAPALSGSAAIDIQEAEQRLKEHNSRSWKKRVNWMMNVQSSTVKNIRRLFSGADEPPHDIDDHETILSIPNRSGLMTIIITDLHLVVDKPSFPLQDLPSFMHEVGKGMPLDMQYALLVPLNLSLEMGESRVMLRDYPLNLLHVPGLKPSQSQRLPSWSFKTDFVIAEEWRDEHSARSVNVEVVPRGQQLQDGTEVHRFAVDVRRTLTPVKMYAKPIIDINTNWPTTISWGTSYQPVIQDVMATIEGFTKPEIDPSAKVGFWDKIRLHLHARFIVNWKGEGDLQLRLKGSHDPYRITGYGAGFVMCWRNDVQWCINTSDDPRKFMTVRSGEYLLAIPDFSLHARHTPEHKAQRDADSMSSGSSHKSAAVFKKVIMKVSGNVQWTAGLVFEQDLEGGGRSPHFMPHYDVVFKNPKYISAEQLKRYDAFRGFRSQHIHMSWSVAAPFDKDWGKDMDVPTDSYNSLHLSPRFFSHFFDWWHQFSGSTSLPIRQGPLWGDVNKVSVKFGRHLSTIKYGLLLSPLYISHVYKHKDAEDYQQNVVSATGLKLRVDSLMIDLHQRREWFDTMSKSKGKALRTSALKINKTEVDFVSADLRAVAASIAGTTAEDLRKATDDALASYQAVTETVDMSQFEIPDHDFSWIDMDDFVELDWILPAQSNPETKILPLAYTPRFTYFRQTDHGDSISGDTSRTSPFGDEDTHFCTMSRHNDPRKIQMDIISQRLQNIEAQLEEHGRLMNEQELKVVREGDQDPTLKSAHESLTAQQKELESKRTFLEHGLRRLASHSNPGEVPPYRTDEQIGNHDGSATSPVNSDNSLPPPGPGTSQVDMDALYSAPPDEFASDFNNRFIIHNMQLKWNNSLRNIVLRYSHQMSQRRGFVYYMSRRAVRFILDIVDEQMKTKVTRQQYRSHPDIPATPIIVSPNDDKDDDDVVRNRIDQLLNDATRFVNADEGNDEPQRPSTSKERRGSVAEPDHRIADNFQANNSYHLRMIAPQIQLQSEKNTRSVIIVSAKGMQLKVVSIMDKARLSDDVSGLVQRRFALDMDGAQFFVANQKLLAKYIHLYSGNRYGNPPGTTWPPWISIEAMFDFHLDPFGFQRVIQKTSASLRYAKYNPLRLKYNEDVAGNDDGSIPSDDAKDSRLDELYVDFPRLRASCDSVQYYTIYIIVLDLLMYSEPLEKTRSERLEKIMLASDFSDLRGAPEMAESLQERIRQLEEIKLQFQINAKYLDKDGWQDRINVEKDLTNCEDELFFLMKAINTSQQKNDDRKSAQSSGLLRWYLSASEIVWHLIRDKDEPLLELQLGNTAYERIDNVDGSNHNAVEIEKIRGWNLLSNALYPEIIAPYHDPSAKQSYEQDSAAMLRIHWYMLEAIAGIPVVEQFVVTLHPLKVQLERDMGQKLFEYIFPTPTSTNPGNSSPSMIRNVGSVMEEEDSESEQARNILEPKHSPPDVTASAGQASSTGAIGRRMAPTYNLNVPKRRVASGPSKQKGLGISSDHRHTFFRPLNNSHDSKELVRKSSASSLRSLRKITNGSSTSLVGLGNAEAKRSDSSKGHKESRLIKKAKKNKPGDDLSQMMNRASNYMTLAHVKLNSVVLCLSYKGKSDRNIEDLNNFVFRMPTLEYRNKTWSNLDLALRLKKDAIRALISHTGAIIGNKFHSHRPNKQQQHRLRDLASHSTIIPNAETIANTASNSENGSLYSFAPEDVDDDESQRISFQSPVVNNNDRLNGTNGHAPLIRSGSWTSSIVNERPVTAAPAASNPLSTIRPSTAHHTQGRSLLKDTFGRHFSSDTIKGKMVHFGGSSLGSIRGHHNEGEDAEHEDPEGHKRKSVLLLGKKVLGRLG